MASDYHIGQYIYYIKFKDSAFVFVNHFLLLLFSILFTCAFGFFKKLLFVYSFFFLNSDCFLWRLVIAKKQAYAGFYWGLNSFLPGCKSQRLSRKVCEKVIEKRTWKAEGLSDESQARNLAVKNIFSPPKNELVESNVTLKGKSKCLKSRLWTWTPM